MKNIVPIPTFLRVRALLRFTGGLAALAVASCACPQTSVDNAPQGAPKTAQIYPNLEDDDWIFKDRLYDYNVLFVNVMWKEWETEPGKFDTRDLDEKLTRARGLDGKRKLALRFQVMAKGCVDEAPPWLDSSWKNEATMDKKTCPRKEGCPGSAYWSIKWELEAVRSRHADALMALGRWVEQHHESIAWVELGSYGFWGEWHHHECDPLGFTATNVQHEVDAWRARLGEIVDQYFCAFPSTPLTIAFDSLKIGGSSAPTDDPVRSRLREGGVGLYFDAFGNDDDDFLHYVTKEAANELTGPFGAEFQGDDDENKKTPGSIRALNEKSDDSWAKTEKILADYPFQFLREGGADLLHPKHHQKLNKKGQGRFDRLIKALAKNHEERRGSLQPRAEPRACRKPSAGGLHQ